MHNTLKKIYYQHSLIKKYGRPLRGIYKFFEQYLLPTKWLIKKQFKRAHKYSLNLSHPTTLNEKIQWMKLNIRDDLYTQCADKFSVREYIADTVGKECLVPLVGIYNGVNEINPEHIPSHPIIVKATHDSGSYRIIRNTKNIHWDELKATMGKWLEKNYYTISKEWQYKNIQPRIIIEKLLVDRNNNIPTDYKIHCFHGEPKVIYVTSDREGRTKRNIYDLQWNALPMTWASLSKREKYGNRIQADNIKKPLNLKAMLSIARKLSQPFPDVRTDLYELNESIFCGEITFYQGGGFDIITPIEWDYKLGALLTLPHALNP